MTPAQTQLLQDSLTRIAPRADQFARSFYARLFEIDPALRPLFRADMISQGRKLMDMLGTVIARLEDLPSIVPAVQMLGVRHADYGVQAIHYESVAAALFWALERELGSAFTPQLRDAWTAAYTLLADTMKAAAARAN